MEYRATLFNPRQSGIQNGLNENSRMQRFEKKVNVWQYKNNKGKCRY